MMSLLLVTSGSVHPNPGPQHGTEIQLCHVNMRSLQPTDRSVKIDELHSTLCIDNKFDVICVSEIWLDKTIPDSDVALHDYQLYRNDRNRHGGGVAIYAHNSLPVRHLVDFLIADVEIVCIEVKVNTKKIIVACYYRPPGNREQSDEFLTNFQIILNMMYLIEADSLFILGDFNDRCVLWDDDHRNSELGTRFKECINNKYTFPNY
jgi:hypothetical protein